ncbi:MAG: hypothetical protein LKG20_10960 [Tetrasphaera jenkinsii]|jgi:hypothetical protein|uniref:Uncharacterized protein n=1 Tax=Nostocoides jenkinsii Ben 74 TaxID=1193518 RepID=A0A077ME10_9MICO|nr:DUF6882 domain-containing protein [Tetrasphaera jenkinsii]MCI1262769.1 hypothetical protein [Tetrasphaera jenkinsii]CCI54175.1 hypothetical protein BN13_610006 [Tetrasphaera jenkinsii Ben 74]
MTIRSDLADLPWPDLVSAAREAIPVCSDAHWQVDLEAGTITHGDEPDARVDPIQVIGTFDASGPTWMWGWEHTSVPVEWGAAAARLKSYGERPHRDDLTTAVVTARPVGPRLWQVTYERRLDAAAMNEGYLVMLFDDAPQLVDKIVAD